MSGRHSTPVRRRRYERPLAVIGAAAILVVGIESVSVAATGSAFILGRSNKAATTTVLTTTKAVSPALALRTRSTATAPFTTNARGKVVNLNSDKVDGLDASAIIAAGRTGGSADTLGGKTAAQIVTEARTAVNATTVQGQNPTQLIEAAVEQAIAFAQVEGDGSTLRSTPSATVIRPLAGTGFYCLHFPGFSQTTGVATVSPDWSGDSTTSGTPGSTTHVEVARTSSGYCADADDFLVITYRDNGTNVALSDEPFSIMVTG